MLSMLKWLAEQLLVSVKPNCHCDECQDCSLCSCCVGGDAGRVDKCWGDVS